MHQFSVIYRCFTQLCGLYVFLGWWSTRGRYAHLDTICFSVETFKVNYMILSGLALNNCLFVFSSKSDNRYFLRPFTLSCNKNIFTTLALFLKENRSIMYCRFWRNSCISITENLFFVWKCFGESSVGGSECLLHARRFCCM